MSSVLNWIRAHAIASVVIAFILGLAMGQVSVEDPDAKTVAAPADTPEPTEEPVVEEEEPEPPPAVAEPDGTFTHSCTYVLGDFSESPSGYRFLGDAKLTNTGNVEFVADATATWFLAGGDKVTVEKEVKVPYGESKKIGFKYVASQDELTRHQDYSLANNKACAVRVKITDSFGEPVE